MIKTEGAIMNEVIRNKVTRGRNILAVGGMILASALMMGCEGGEGWAFVSASLLLINSFFLLLTSVGKSVSVLNDSVGLSET